MNGGLGNDGSPQKLSAGPKSRTCYICGRPYGTNSYEIHLKQCKELWIAREAQKDPKERKPLPEDPFANGGFSPANPRRGSGGGAGRGQGGDDSDDGDGGDTGGDGRQLTLEEMNKIAGAAFNEVALDTCLHCGRTFLPEKLKIHNKSCTADNPAKRVGEHVRSGSEPVEVSDVRGPQKRPSSQSALKRPTEATSPVDNEALNLRVSNGSLVGSIGGPSGRQLRKNNNNTGTKVSSSSDNVFGMPNMDNKEEVMAFLVNKISSLEATASTILQELDEVKSIMYSIQSNGGSNSDGIAS